MGAEVVFSALFLIGIYGDVTKIDTTGASKVTASQDNLSYYGVQASHTMAQTDLGRMNQYKTIITNVGTNLQMDPAVIAGIISRESRAGNVLVNGWGDGGNGFGLMQVDKRYHNPVGAWNSQEHVNQGTGILIDFIKQIQRKFPEWTRDMQMKGGISAYNAVVGNVQTYEGMDIGTTGNDYANDVVARSQWYKRNGY